MDSIVTEKIRETSQITQEDDQLRFYSLAEHLLDYILSKKFPITVGLYGKWGSGKTVLANYIKEISEKRKEKIEFIVFDVATFRNSGNNLFWHFILKIYKMNSKKGWQGWIIKLLLFIPNLVKFVIKCFTNASSEFVDDIIRSEDLRKNIIEKTSKKYSSNKKYFVIIDNLDRLTPQDTITFLEQLKHFLLSDSEFSFDNFAFLLLCDFDIISAEVEKIYNNKIDVRDYLNKIIEVPFYLPSFEQVQVENLTKSLLNNKISADNANCICDLLRFSNFNTPRDIKNYLLELDMIFVIAKSRGHNEDYLLDNLNKILAMQIIKTKYFEIYKFLKDTKENLYRDINLNGLINLVKEFYVYEHPNSTKNYLEFFDSREDQNLKIVYNLKVTYQMLRICQLLKDANGQVVLDNDIERVIEIIDSTSQNISISLSDTIKINDKVKLNN